MEIKDNVSFKQCVVIGAGISGIAVNNYFDSNYKII